VLAHIANVTNFDHYARELDAMHRHRRRIFVDLLGWRALSGPKEHEADTFDGPDATYILVLDEDGVYRASARLLPTTGAHMMAELFRAFVDGPPPRGPDILEWSRHCPGDPAWPAAINEAARLALHTGVLAYALERGVRAFTAVMDRGLLRRARSYGWDCTPLGPPRAYGEGEAIAVLNPVCAAHLEALRARAGVTGPVLFARGDGARAA